MRHPMSWLAPIGKYRLYNDAGKLVDELNEKEKVEFLKTIPEDQAAYYDSPLLDPDCIEAKGWNLSAGQYKPFVFSEAGSQIPVSDQIKELQNDVAGVQTRLEKLLQMVG